MKKVLSFIMLFLLLAGYQKAKAQFLDAGIRAGANYPSLAGIETDVLSGFHAGVYFKMNFLGLWAVEPGIQYSQKGFRATSNTNIGQASDRFHTIDVPVLVRFAVLPLVNVFAGPQASYLVSRNYSDNLTAFTNTDNLRNYDLSGVVGVGINLPLGFNIQGSYDFGITSINYNNNEAYNNVVKISLGKDF